MNCVTAPTAVTQSIREKRRSCGFLGDLGGSVSSSQIRPKSDVVRSARIATSTSPEALNRGANESRLLAPGRIAHLPSQFGQWCYERACDARYSGGAAPAFNRFPWLPFAISCKSNLAPLKCPCKRSDHRAADNYSQRDEITTINGRLSRWRQIDHRHGVQRNIVGEKSAKASALEDDRSSFLELRALNGSPLILDEYFEYLRRLKNSNTQWKRARRKTVTERQLRYTEGDWRKYGYPRARECDCTCG